MVSAKFKCSAWNCAAAAANLSSWRPFYLSWVKRWNHVWQIKISKNMQHICRRKEGTYIAMQRACREWILQLRILVCIICIYMLHIYIRIHTDTVTQLHLNTAIICGEWPWPTIITRTFYRNHIHIHHRHITSISRICVCMCMYVYVRV